MISKQEFKNRRQNFIKKMAKNSIALIPAAHECQRNHDNLYLFRQQSDFFYLTGFNEPEAIAAFIPGRKEGEFILFNRKRVREEELWTGYRAGQEGAVKEFFADQSFAVDQFTELLPALLEDKEIVYFALGRDKPFDQKVVDAIENVRLQVRKGVAAPEEFRHVDPLIHELRLIKSAEEIALIRKISEVSAQAHRRAMEVVKPGMNEYEIEALVQYEFQRHGARSPAYTPIVAGGANACILHYNDNNKELENNDLLLIDAGGELECYASDITRTFPVNGKFSPEQKAIYEIVLKSQLAGLAEVKPGNPWNKIQEAIIRVITQGLVELDIMQGDVDKLIQDKKYRDFYMHNSGHWLGLDTHDVGSYKINGQWRSLAAGMVITVEPGIYIAPDLDVDPKWHGIGVRIEDDVLVTATGHDVLTSHAPKTVEAIESLMKK